MTCRYDEALHELQLLHIVPFWTLWSQCPEQFTISYSYQNYHGAPHCAVSNVHWREVSRGALKKKVILGCMWYIHTNSILNFCDHHPLLHALWSEFLVRELPSLSKKESLNEWGNSLLTVLQSKILGQCVKIQSLSKWCPHSLTEN